MKRAIVFFLCLSLVLSLAACAAGSPQSTDVFYYPRSESGSLSELLAPEPRELEPDAELSQLLELYCAGPLTPGLEGFLPPGTAVRSCRVEEGVLYLDFDPGLAQLSGIELTLAAGCLAKTFLERCGAHTLVLTAGDALLNGETALRLSLPDLNLRDSSPDLLHREFTIYYASTDRRYLIGHDVSVQVSSPEELPQQLLELLMEPPSGSGLRSALPDGVRFSSITVEDGLCTVDVSQEFETRRFSALSAQCLSLLSVVNTLTALEEIQRVEFTVEGNLLIRYGSLSIDAPLVRDLRCIGPVRTGLGELDALIYLVHGSEDLLVPIPARLRPGTAQSLPELVVRHLLQDPGTNGIQSRIPQGTQLNSLSLSDGLCVVDLSPEYLSDPAKLRACGRVIAASLCQLEEVEQVQILVNGKVPEGYDPALFGILTPNPDWFL